MIYGLTGGICTGKSHILKYMEKLGYDTMDLDKIGHSLLNEENCKKEILEKISNNILDKNNNIDRKKLGSIVFSNKKKLETLNEIMHKLIIKKMTNHIEFYRQNKKDLVVEVPLLFEVGLEKYFDSIILAYTPFDVQIKRVMLRDDKTYDEALKVIESQINIESKKNKSDIIINTDDDYIEVEKEIRRIFNEYKKG